MNSVLSPECMIDISRLIAAHFVPVMVHVLSFPFGSPSWTDVQLTCHNDTAFVMHVIPHQVLPIMVSAGHHLYSRACPKSVSDDVFPMKKAKIKPVISHVQSAHKMNGDNQAQEPGWEGQKKGFVRERPCTHTKKKISEKPRYSRNLRKDSST